MERTNSLTDENELRDEFTSLAAFHHHRHRVSVTRILRALPLLRGARFTSSATATATAPMHINMSRWRTALLRVLGLPLLLPRLVLPRLVLLLLVLLLLVLLLLVLLVLLVLVLVLLLLLLLLLLRCNSW